MSVMRPMKNKIIVSGIEYVSAKDGADLTGYSTDYIARVAKLGKVPAKKFGKGWLIDREALLHFHQQNLLSKVDRGGALSRQRQREYRNAQFFSHVTSLPQAAAYLSHSGSLRVLATLLTSFVVVFGGFFGFQLYAAQNQDFAAQLFSKYIYTATALHAKVVTIFDVADVSKRGDVRTSNLDDSKAQEFAKKSFLSLQPITPKSFFEGVQGERSTATVVEIEENFDLKNIPTSLHDVAYKVGDSVIFASIALKEGAKLFLMSYQEGVNLVALTGLRGLGRSEVFLVKTSQKFVSAGETFVAYTNGALSIYEGSILSFGDKVVSFTSVISMPEGVEGLAQAMISVEVPSRYKPQNVLAVIGGFAEKKAIKFADVVDQKKVSTKRAIQKKILEFLEIEIERNETK